MNSLLPLVETILDHPLSYTKKQFGAISVFFDQKQVLVLCDSPGETTWRKKDYGMELWYGVMIPMERENHALLQKDFPKLSPHPFLGKWLFLSARDPDFEETLEKLSELILRKDPRIGIFISF